MPEAAIRNIATVNRALLQAGEQFQREKRSRLASFGVPVERDAEVLARTKISNIGGEWWEMRVGVTPDMVYVAPVQRGTKFGNRKRRTFARTLLDRAMIPALDRNRREVGDRIDALVERMVRRFNRG